MNFAIRVAPTACVVRVAVASSAVFALRVAVAARVVSAASIADGFVPGLAARTAGIILRTLWYGVFLSIVLAPARNPSLKQTAIPQGSKRWRITNAQEHSLQFRPVLDFRHRWYCKPRLSHAVVSTSRAPTVQKEAHRKRIGRLIGAAGG